MELEERLEQLEAGHRAMAVQHVALLHVSKVMFALIGLNATASDKALLLAYDQASEYMDKADMDSTFQRDVRAEIDALASMICGVARAAPPSGRTPPTSVQD